jgi:hypothetical protein
MDRDKLTVNDMKRFFCMKGVLSLSLLFVMIVSGVDTTLYAQKREEMKFVDAGELMLIGKGFEETTVEYGRVPVELEHKLRPQLLSLGTNSAGLAVRFNTNSSYVGVEWKLLHDVSMNHMPDTGIKGLDLYILEKGVWRYAGTARPGGKENFAIFIKSMTKERREFIAYLPLYDGVESVSIGVDPDAEISAPLSNRLVKSEEKRPILFYGTSITQGGCASRPGMAYTSILGRKLDRETINLGFSGNARMDFAMAEAIAMVDAEAVVLDCLPNTTAQGLKDSAYVFIRHILDNRPGMPVYMVENPNFPHLFADTSAKAQLREENEVWRDIFARLLSEGYDNVTYIRGDNLLGEDGETTVDSVHFTDLGFLRFAESLLEYLTPYGPAPQMR